MARPHGSCQSSHSTDNPSSSSVGGAPSEVVVPRPGPWQGVVVVPGRYVEGGLHGMDLSYAGRRVTPERGVFAGRHG